MATTTLGRYRIVRELGRGAMGHVYLAHDATIDRPVALKTMQAIAALPEGERAAARERFAREARAAGRLNHPGIVTIFDVGESDGVPYLAMEYLEGTTLDAFTGAERRLPREEVVTLVAGAALALAQAHAAGIVHRDVKPQNLMRLGPGRLKVLDFGLAKSPLAGLTQDGTLLGTPSYMAPEQIKGAAVDGRADLFSLAVVLYELLTGVKPFGGESVSTILYRIVHEEPGAAPMPPPLEAFFRRALAKDPEARFPDGAAFAAGLRQSLRAPAAPRPTPSAPSSEVPPPAPPPPRVRAGRPAWLPWVAAAVVVLAGGGFAIVRLGARSGAAPPAVPGGGTVRVRTEPAGLPLTLNGRPFSSNTLELPAEAPFGTLALTLGCRELRRDLTPADAGQEVVLVADPVRAAVPVAPEMPGALVALNGAASQPAPATVDLDLCIANTVEVSAPGYRAARTEIPAGARPLDARTALAGLTLEKIPEGTLHLPAPRYGVTWRVDGAPVEAGDLQLPEGAHEVRALNEDAWLDRTMQVEVRAGETASPSLEGRLADLVVQTFPANCRVALRREAREAWKDVDDTPLRKGIVAGTYQVRVTHRESGASQEREVRLKPGANPPIRFAFRRGA